MINYLYHTDDDFAAERDAASSAVDHLSVVAPDWGQCIASSSTVPGCPLMLVISPAAIRASQLNRSVDTVLCCAL